MKLVTKQMSVIDMKHFSREDETSVRVNEIGSNIIKLNDSEGWILYIDQSKSARVTVDISHHLKNRLQDNINQGYEYIQLKKAS